MEITENNVWIGTENDNKEFTIQLKTKESSKNDGKNMNNDSEKEIENNLNEFVKDKLEMIKKYA